MFLFLCVTTHPGSDSGCDSTWQLCQSQVLLHVGVAVFPAEGPRPEQTSESL